MDKYGNTTVTAMLCILKIPVSQCYHLADNKLAILLTLSKYFFIVNHISHFQ